MARLFVSDVHLDVSAPEATEQFLAFLAAEAAAAQALYILGDLFEAWVGDDDADPDKERVCQALQSPGARAACRASRCTATATSCSVPGSASAAAASC